MALRENAPDRGVRLSEAAPVLLDYYSALSLVFGGCCVNVWVYEQLLLMNPRIGSALTFSQMLFITLQALPSFLYLPSKSSYLPQLRPRQVPLREWVLQVFVLSTGSLLNNWAYSYKVPMTLMIVFRSAGLAVSMLLGALVLKKRYTGVQVSSVVLVSVGVILATLYRPGSPTSSSTKHNVVADAHTYSIGILMLVVSLLLSGVLGLLQERAYQKYGPHWKEGVFYTHVLSLPIFLFLISDVQQGLGSLSSNNHVKTPSLSYLILACNLISQLICVSGVNRLSSQVSSVSTNLILTTRKALSLLISVWWFGNGWNAQLGLGAAMVFSGSLLFSWGSSSGKANQKGSADAQQDLDKKKKN